MGISVTNCSVTNFDDSVCVKPLAAGEKTRVKRGDMPSVICEDVLVLLYNSITEPTTTTVPPYILLTQGAPPTGLLARQTSRLTTFESLGGWACPWGRVSLVFRLRLLIHCSSVVFCASMGSGDN